MVLLVAFLLEGWSTLEAFNEFKEAKGKLGWFQAMRQSKDPPSFIVLLENGAAMAGIIAAAVGLVLSQLTGDPFFDGAASVVIGVILGLTAICLLMNSKGLLIGEAADPELVAGLHDLACSKKGVVGVGHVLTVHSSPDQITAMVNVDFDDKISAGESSAIVCRRSRTKRAMSAGPQVRRAVHPPDPGRGEERKRRKAYPRPYHTQAQRVFSCAGQAGWRTPHGADGASVDARRLRPAERVDPDQRQRRAEAARRGRRLGLRQRLHARRWRVGGASGPQAASSPSSTAISTACSKAPRRSRWMSG